jgi:hypothetical protein
MSGLKKINRYGELTEEATIRKIRIVRRDTALGKD